MFYFIKLAFEVARGHKMERENYLNELKKIGNRMLPSLAIDTDVDKATQTQPGFWITENSLPKSARNNSNDLQPHLDDMIEPQQQVNLCGYVNVQHTDLIPDGRGGYFVRVQKRDIQKQSQWTTSAPLPQPHKHQNRFAPYPQQNNNSWRRESNRPFDRYAEHPPPLPHYSAPSNSMHHENANFTENLSKLAQANRNRRNNYSNREFDHQRRRF